MGNSTLCKIVTPENFSSKVCIRDYVGDGNYRANFGENRFSGGFSQSRWLFWLSCPFFSILRPGRTVELIFTLYGSNDVFPHKEVPFAGHDNRWHHLGKICPQNPLKVRVNRQIQPKMPKYENRSNNKILNPIKPKFEDKAETTSCTSWVGYRCHKPNPTWLTAAILKIAMTS